MVLSAAKPGETGKYMRTRTGTRGLEPASRDSRPLSSQLSGQRMKSGPADPPVLTQDMRRGSLLVRLRTGGRRAIVRGVYQSVA